MKKAASVLAEKITAGRDLLKPAERYRIAVLESRIGITGNIILALLKLAFGLLSNSIALIADSVHSLSDVFSSAVVLIGFSLAGRKPDPEHPHGHGRSEYLAGLLIAVMLIGAGLSFIYYSYRRLNAGVFASPSIAALAAVAAAIMAKEFMYQLSLKLGHLIKSEALVADAWHHRSDSLSSFLVLMALAGSYFGLPALDAYLGFGVSLLIIYAGIKIARKSCSLLLGAAPDPDLQENIFCCARNTDGVIDAHDLEIHDYGSWKVITIHIGVNGQLSLDRAHRIAFDVEEKISDRFHCNAIVHLDPR